MIEAKIWAAISLLLFIVGICIVIGQFVLSLREMKRGLKEVRRKRSWAQIEAAQAEFNVDFFDYLRENDPKRLTNG